MWAMKENIKLSVMLDRCCLKINRDRNCQKHVILLHFACDRLWMSTHSASRGNVQRDTHKRVYRWPPHEDDTHFQIYDVCTFLAGKHATLEHTLSLLSKTVHWFDWDHHRWGQHFLTTPLFGSKHTLLVDWR